MIPAVNRTRLDAHTADSAATGRKHAGFCLSQNVGHDPGSSQQTAEKSCLGKKIRGGKRKIRRIREGLVKDMERQNSQNQPETESKQSPRHMGRFSCTWTRRVNFRGHKKVISRETEKNRAAAIGSIAPDAAASECLHDFLTRMTKPIPTAA